MKLDGATSVGAALRDFMADRSSANVPGFERGVINDDLSLTPDSWSGPPFAAPGLGGDLALEYLAARHLVAGESEPALIGMTDTGTSSSGASLEHTHPNRELQAGDRVVMIWLGHGTVAAQPFVMEVVG